MSKVVAMTCNDNHVMFTNVSVQGRIQDFGKGGGGGGPCNC